MNLIEYIAISVLGIISIVLGFAYLWKKTNKNIEIEPQENQIKIHLYKNHQNIGKPILIEYKDKPFWKIIKEIMEQIPEDSISYQWGLSGKENLHIVHEYLLNEKIKNYKEFDFKYLTNKDENRSFQNIFLVWNNKDKTITQYSNMYTDSELTQLFKNTYKKTIEISYPKAKIRYYQVDYLKDRLKLEQKEEESSSSSSSPLPLLFYNIQLMKDGIITDNYNAFINQPLHSIISDLLDKIIVKKNKVIDFEYELVYNTDKVVTHENQIIRILNNNPKIKFQFKYSIKNKKDTEKKNVIQTLNWEKNNTINFDNNVKNIDEWKKNQKNNPTQVVKKLFKNTKITYYEYVNAFSL